MTARQPHTTTKRTYLGDPAPQSQRRHNTEIQETTYLLRPYLEEPISVRLLHTRIDEKDALTNCAGTNYDPCT